MGRYQNPVINFDEPAKKSSISATEKKESFSDIEKEHTKNDEYSLCENMYFAFIDILGFKKVFDDNRENDQEKFGHKFSAVFSYFFEIMNAAKFMSSDQNCYAGQTSDSLYFYTDRADYLLQFIKLFSHFNAYSMMNDVFFRGGIAKGNLFRKANYQFYGDCVIRAYLLESEIAKNPVVYVDQNTYDDLKKQPDFDEDLVVKDNNCSRHYIYPFAGLSMDIGEYIDEISVIKENLRLPFIEDNIKKNKKLFEYDARNFSKYVFLEAKLTDSKEV